MIVFCYQKSSESVNGKLKKVFKQIKKYGKRGKLTKTQKKRLDDKVNVWGKLFKNVA